MGDFEGIRGWLSRIAGARVSRVPFFLHSTRDTRALARGPVGSYSNPSEIYTAQSAHPSLDME